MEYFAMFHSSMIPTKFDSGEGCKMDAEQKAILLHPEDNTVTALADLKPGQAVATGSDAANEPIVIRQEIPYAHKFARVFIPKGADIKKYGEVIGIAVADIHPGGHVHVHNVEGKRAREEFL